MNLPAILKRRPEPGDLKAVLARRFDHVHYAATGHGAFAMELAARDETGRVRLRLPFFWSERLSAWIYLIEKGEPA